MGVPGDILQGVLNRSPIKQSDERIVAEEGPELLSSIQNYYSIHFYVYLSTVERGVRSWGPDPKGAWENVANVWQLQVSCLLGV